MSIDETAASSIHGSKIMNRNAASSRLSSRKSVFSKQTGILSQDESRPVSASTGIR